MEEQVITRRRVIRSDEDALGESGTGAALAIALAVLALLALFALARGAFNPAPAEDSTVPSTTIQTEGGATID
jgi:hypothetical protein